METISRASFFLKKLFQKKKIKKQTSLREEVLETIRFIFLAILIIVPLRVFVAQPFIVLGASMDPTFKDGQYLIIDEISYRFKNPARGDVIVFKFPKDTSKYFIKRIIGLPGETVFIENGGTVSVKKETGEIIILEEPYVAQKNRNSGEYSLGKDEYFVLGDNRSGSYDSRTWGTLPEKLIVGRTFLRLFPFSQAEIFPGEFASLDT